MTHDPYKIIKSRYITEKSTVLESLCQRESNPSLKRCQKPKYVFLVDVNANKQEIRQAVEAIYDNKIKVKAVNTIRRKPKPKRVRGRLGQTAGFKKAIVTLEVGDKIEAEV